MKEKEAEKRMKAVTCRPVEKIKTPEKRIPNILRKKSHMVAPILKGGQCSSTIGEERSMKASEVPTPKRKAEENTLSVGIPKVLKQGDDPQLPTHAPCVTPQKRIPHNLKRKSPLKPSVIGEPAQADVEAG